MKKCKYIFLSRGHPFHNKTEMSNGREFTFLKKTAFLLCRNRWIPHTKENYLLCVPSVW